MCSVRSFVTDDLFNFNHVNLDLLTETYNLPFYLKYLAQWPEYFLAAQSPNRECMGYSKYFLLAVFLSFIHPSTKA